MGNNFFGDIHVLIMLLTKGAGPFSLNEIFEVADYIQEESHSFFYRCTDPSIGVDTIEQYPELFRKEVINGEIVFFKGEKIPNLYYFFSEFNENIVPYFSRLIDRYLKRKNDSLVYCKSKK